MTYEKMEKQKVSKLHVKYGKREESREFYEAMTEIGSSLSSCRMWLFTEHAKEHLKSLGVLR